MSEFRSEPANHVNLWHSLVADVPFRCDLRSCSGMDVDIQRIVRQALEETRAAGKDHPGRRRPQFVPYGVPGRRHRSRSVGNR